MQLKTQVIVNPVSNKGRTRRRWHEIRDSIRAYIKEFAFEFTEKPSHASEIARCAVKGGAELIIGVGGDGTINEIANGFFEDRRIINPDAALGILPAGTGCDLMKSLDIPLGFRKAMKTITEAPSLNMDVGRVTYTRDDGRTEDRLFLNVADFGLGGQVVKRVNERRLKRKASSYFRCMIEAMLNYRSPKVAITVDGLEIPPEEYLIGAVANGGVFGKGMKIAPDADLTDGLFNAVLIRNLSFLEFIIHGWRLAGGRIASHPKVRALKAALIEARPLTAEPVLLEFDGEQIGMLPARFEIMGRCLPVKGYQR